MKTFSKYSVAVSKKANMEKYLAPETFKLVNRYISDIREDHVKSLEKKN